MIPRISNSVEQEFYCEIIREFLREGTESLVAPSGIQWALLQHIFYRDPRSLQPLSPILFRTNAPWETKTEIASCTAMLREQTLQTLDALPTVLSALERNDIAAIVLKGPAISYSIYGCPKSRFVSDIDLLCTEDNIEKAGQVLQDIGYEFTTEGRLDAFYEQHHFHHIYCNDEGIYVEIHWDLTVPSDYARFIPSELFADSQILSRDGLSFAALKPVDMLLHIVSQARPSFDSTGRLLDVCLLIKAGALDDPTLVSKARSSNLSTSLWLMLKLAEEVMDLPTSANLKKLRPMWFARICLYSLPVKMRMFGPVTAPTGEIRLLRMLCCPTLLDAWNWFRRYIVPSQEDLHIDRHNSPGDITLIERIKLSRAGLFSVIKMISYLIWRLLLLPLDFIRYVASHNKLTRGFRRHNM